MTSFCVLLSNLYFLLCLLTCHGCHEQDRRALLDFKSSLSDPANRLSSWKDSYQHQNCCNWHGVLCSHDSFRVISISLRNTVDEAHFKGSYHSVQYHKIFSYNSAAKFIDDVINFKRPNNSLTGKFSPSLFNINHLEYIDLAYNNFQSTQIPLELSNLTKLSHLDLSKSNIGSSISTQFNNLSSLHLLDLSENGNLQSSSIKWVRGLVNLQVLNLSGIDLNEASFSKENFAEHISHVSNLRDLDLSSCNISGFPSFHNLSFLSSLNMKSNYHLNSEIPVQLENLTSLSTLYLSGCGLQGPVPHLPQLKELDVSFNQNLNLDLARMFQHPWPKLQKLTISNNNVSGAIPDSLSNAPLLVSLSASECSIQGSLPSSVYSLSELESLDLSNNDITGYIQSSVSNLKFLTILDLSWNRFQGSVPKSISNLNLKFLTSLHLSCNHFQGSIPKSISNLKFLTSLDLTQNKFQGSIPKSISNLKSLNILRLSYNDFQGPIPSSICKCLSLRELYLQSNNITGTIPSCISKLRNLTVFSVYENSIGGNVSLVSLINDLDLTTIDLSSNRLTVVIDQNFRLYSKFKLESLVLPSCNLKGLFPTFICKLTYLESLDLSHNNFTGVIPSCISKLKNLFLFDVSNNKLSGKISIEIGKRLSNFQYINLSGNQLSGSIPSSICSNSTSNLQIIDLSKNKFSGIIPNTLGYCKHLESLNFGRNNLTGNVPKEIEQLQSLSFLQLQDNNLEGTPLNFISKLPMKVLNLANNQFQGSIPTTLIGSQYHPLRIISLRSNKFNGSIPDEINNLNQLQILDLSHNKISGHIPKQLGGYWMKLTGVSKLLTDGYDTQSQMVIKGVMSELRDFYNIQLQMVINGIMLEFEKIYIYTSGLDLSCNMLDGNIPTEIGQLIGLARLNLSNNQFSGSIPASIGDMSNLVTLDLSFNRLSGQIPPSLISLDSLGFFNLSYNQLSGKIPRGIHFDTLSVDGWAFVGNALLCGEPTKQVCEVEEDDQDQDASDKLILYSVIFWGFGVGFWGLFLVMLIKKEKWWFPYWRFIDFVVSKMYSNK